MFQSDGLQLNHYLVVFGTQISRISFTPGSSIDYIYIVILFIYIYTYMIYIYMVSCSLFLPPQWYGSPGSTQFPSICKLLAAFLRSSLVFARFLQRFWLPASHLLGTCYLLDNLRSTHTPSKYLRATYSYVYMCYVSTSYIYIHKNIIDKHIHIYICIYIHTHFHIYTNIYIYKKINTYTYLHTYIYTHTCIHTSLHINICIYR